MKRGVLGTKFGFLKGGSNRFWTLRIFCGNRRIRIENRRWLFEIIQKIEVYIETASVHKLQTQVYVYSHPLLAGNHRFLEHKYGFTFPKA